VRANAASSTGNSFVLLLNNSFTLDNSFRKKKERSIKLSQATSIRGSFALSKQLIDSDQLIQERKSIKQSNLREKFFCCLDILSGKG
jgi:hypothetical protein